MAKVKEVGLCPRCSGELPKEALTKCPTCNYQFPYQNEVFGTPDYITSQYEVLNSAVENEIATKDSKRWTLDRAHMKFLINMADQDRIFALRDAEEILKLILPSNSTGESLKQVLEVGKRIGILAEATDKLIKAGGKPNGFFDTTQPRSDRKDPFDFGGEDGNPAL